jgi:hypothetical protein
MMARDPKIAVPIMLLMYVASNLGLEARVLLEHGLQADRYLPFYHAPLFSVQPEMTNSDLFLTDL